MVLVRKWSDSIGLCFGSLPYVVPPRQYRIHVLMENHGGFLWNSIGLRLRNDTAGGIMSTGMHLDHCRTTQWRLIIWQYWIDWHHDRQRAAKKNTGSLYYLFAVRNLWGQWRQCLFSVIYRLVACPKNLFVNHEFKVGSEVVGVASSQLPVCDYPKRKKGTEWREVAVRVLKTPRLRKPSGRRSPTISQ